MRPVHLETTFNPVFIYTACFTGSHANEAFSKILIETGYREENHNLKINSTSWVWPLIGFVRYPVSAELYLLFPLWDHFIEHWGNSLDVATFWTQEATIRRGPLPLLFLTLGLYSTHSVTLPTRSNASANKWAGSQKTWVLLYILIQPC